MLFDELLFEKCYWETQYVNFTLSSFSVQQSFCFWASNSHCFFLLLTDDAEFSDCQMLFSIGNCSRKQKQRLCQISPVFPMNLAT